MGCEGKLGDDVGEAVLREEGREGKLSIEGFKTGNYLGLREDFGDDVREAVLREEGREGKLSIEGF